MGPGTKTAWQHDGRDARRRRNHASSTTARTRRSTASRAAMRIALDLKTHEARLVSAYTHPDPPLLAASQGNVQTLRDGNAVVGYGGVPAISEYAADGSLLFDAHLPLDMSFYRAFRFPWSGRPLSPPAVLAEPQQHGRRDDRARQLERRDRRRRHGACSRASARGR